MRTNTWIGLAVLLSSLLPGANAFGRDRFEEFDAYVEAAMKKWQVPGVAVAIVKDGHVVLLKGYGRRSIRDDLLVDAQTVFPLASITKNFTATALAQLVESGAISWDDPVTKHVPDLQFVDAYRTKHLTIRDLLCHRTGLERGDLLPRRGDVTQREIVRRVRYLQPASEFRSKFGYNNLMYYLAGEVVARKSNAPWEYAIRESLLRPLGMHDTYPTARRVASLNVAGYHRLLDGEITTIERPQAWMGSKGSPAGSMHSSAADMAKWLEFVLAPEDSDLALKQKTRREMQSIHMPIPVTWSPSKNPYAARFYGWGLGWTVLDYRGRKVCYHAGSSGAMLATIPEEKIGVVILTNQEWSKLPGMLMYDVFDAYLSADSKPWSRHRWSFWEKADPHPEEQRKRDFKQAEAKRKPQLKPTLELASYAGSYFCDLYGDIDVRQENGRLFLRYGRNGLVPASHWQADTFYVRRPVGDDASVDWLVTFSVEGKASKSLNIKRLGWHEPLPKFFRRADGSRP